MKHHIILPVIVVTLFVSTLACKTAGTGNSKLLTSDYFISTGVSLSREYMASDKPSFDGYCEHIKKVK